MTERRAVTVRPIGVVREEPDVIVVPYRPRRHSAKLLPPILLLMLGFAFLAYRAHSSDWRGISFLFEARPKVAAAPALPLPPPSEAVEEPTEKIVANAVAVEVKKEGEEKEEKKEKEQKKEQVQEQEKVVEKAAPKREQGDPLDDIRREAEATRERIAGLEKLKEQEARKLDQTADARGRADRLKRRNNLLQFQARALAPEDIDRRLRAQTEQLRRQMAAVARLQLQQMEQMAAIQRDFFNEPAQAQGQGRLPWLVPPPPPHPEFPADRDFARRPPAGAGAAPQVREFPGPNGTRVFRFDFRPGAPRPDDVPPPPPRPLTES